MNIKLSDSELAVMQILWKEGTVKAVDLANKAQVAHGWKKNTTYTLINRLIKKDAIKRTEPEFICTAMVDKKTIYKKESKAFLDKLFDGSLNLFAQAFLENYDLSEEELEELNKIINKG